MKNQEEVPTEKTFWSLCGDEESQAAKILQSWGAAPMGSSAPDSGGLGLTLRNTIPKVRTNSYQTVIQC